MTAFIYKITNSKTNDFYVGSTIQLLKNRFKSHKSNVRINKVNKLYDCIREFGIENFKIEVLEEFEYDENEKQEIYYKEKDYYLKLKPSLNEKPPSIIGLVKIGRIVVFFIQNIV